MSEISRRSFLIKSGAGAAALGTLAVLPIMEGTASAAQRHPEVAHTSTAPVAERPGASEGLMVYVPDPRSGEIHYMVGAREVVQTDPALVARLLREVR